MNREMLVLRDFETFLSKSGTIPNNKTKFYILGQRFEADSHRSKGTYFIGTGVRGGEKWYPSPALLSEHRKDLSWLDSSFQNLCAKP